MFKRFAQFASILFIVSAYGASAANADNFGLLAVYERGSSHNFGKLKSMGCRVWRAGAIGSFRGEFDIRQGRQFALVECQGSVLEKATTRSRLKDALGFLDGGLLLEGEFLLREQEFSTNPDTLDRHYVIKIGRFNNRDVDARQREGAAFFEAAKASPNVFSIEAKFSTSRAVGTSTPDTVEVFYYKNRAVADAFVADVPALIENSHIYNATHFDEFVYFGGTPGPESLVDH